MALQLACEPFLEDSDLVCDCEIGDYTETEIIEAATDALVRMTEGGFRGRCTVTVRPEYDWCYDPDSMAICGPDIDVIILPGVKPVVTEIKIDGAVVAPGDYTLINGNQLLRVGTDRPPAWPHTNPIWKPTTADGTFSITYTHGHVVDFLVKRAALEVACDLIRGLQRGGKLDSYTTSATMDGLTVMRDPDVVEAEGFGWLARFLRLYGTSSAEVWSPEISGGWTLHVTA